MENRSNSILRSICRILLLIIGVTVNFDYFSLEGSVSVVSLLMLVYFVIILLYAVRCFSLKKEYKQLFIPLLIYLLLLIVLNLVNINVESSQVLPISFIFCLFLFFIVIIHVDNDPGASIFLISGIMIGGIIMSLLFMKGIGVEYESGRIRMFGANPNNLACLMSLTVAILLYNCIIKDCYHLKMFRFLLAVFLLPVIQLIFATASRTGFICLALVVFISFLVTPIKRKSTKVVLVAGLLGVFVFGYNYLFSSEYDVLLGRLKTTVEIGDLSGREGRWTQLFPIALEHPFGMGQTGYAELSSRLYSSTEINGYTSPHNVPLEVFLYTGILGLLAMLLFWFRVGKRAVKRLRTENNLLPLLLLSVIIVQMLAGQILILRTAWLSFAYISVRSQINPKSLLGSMEKQEIANKRKG